MQGLWIERGILLCFLGWNTVSDLKKRQVSLLSLGLLLGGWILMAVIPGTRGWVLDENKSLLTVISGFLAGGAIFLLSLATKETIGRGDGLTLCIMGLYLGIYRLLLLMMGGFLTCGLWGAVLILLKKAKRTSRLPFLPFLLAAYVAMLGLEVYSGW